MKKHTMGILGLRIPGGAKNKTEFLDFIAPPFTGKDAVLVPASGRTRRSMTAEVFLRATGEPVRGRKIEYGLEEDIPGIFLEKNLLVIESSVKESATVTVRATDAQGGLTACKKVQIRKDATLRDAPPSPLEKEGWTLVFHDEFDGEALDPSKWSPYYLRHWCDTDERTKAEVFFEDGAMALRCPENAGSWSHQDGQVKVKGIMTMEKTHLHKFGEPGKGAVKSRRIPTFDGYATKYGYFELRVKLPDTKDGSHFAWWMVGTQDDQNITAQPQGEPAPYYGHHSNEVGEFDIIETYLSSLKKMKAWRPVIHTNGTTDYEYLWPRAYTMPGNPSAEFHNFGFEWDEKGTKFYVDGHLAAETDRSPNYRMMTFFSTYATGGMGKDRGIYPKDTYFEYFRVYKKNEPSRATSIVLNGYHTPDFLRVPEKGEAAIPMAATVLDQFDRELEGQPVKWRLSKTIDGFAPSRTENTAELPGVFMDEATGVLTITAEAIPGTDVFITAYVNDRVKQTFHSKLSKEKPEPLRVLFQNRLRTVTGGETACPALVYDQYMEPVAKAVSYYLAVDITGKEQREVAGVSINAQGVLLIEDAVPEKTHLVLAARAGDLLDTMVVTVRR